MPFNINEKLDQIKSTWTKAKLLWAGIIILFNIASVCTSYYMGARQAMQDIDEVKKRQIENEQINTRQHQDINDKVQAIRESSIQNGSKLDTLIEVLKIRRIASAEGNSTLASRKD